MPPSVRQLFTANLIKLTVFSIVCLFIAGCDQQGQTTAQPEAKLSIQKLTIGLVPEQDIFAQKKRFAPLWDYLSEKLGVTIEIKIMPGYGNIIDNFV